ncbi:pimeloyl-ACP methyl ester carboxylesterase [Nocardia sp. GAS34]
MSISHRFVESNGIRMHLTEAGSGLLVVLPGCGHWVQQERPAEVNEALTRFLAGL